MRAQPVIAAVRAWVHPNTKARTRRQRRPTSWRRQAIGERVLDFDTETTVDYAQELLFGFFRVYAHGQLEYEGLIAGECLTASDRVTIANFALRENITVYSLFEFVHVVFYPEVYELGTLCIGFNLPYDLSRIASRFAGGRGRNRHSFSLVLSNNPFLPRVRIQSISARAAFIGFAPCKRRYPGFFQGRFLDCKTLVSALTGESHTLRSAGELFQATVIKSDLGEYGVVTPESLAYGRNDVLATWHLYDRLREDYRRFTFSTAEN